MVKIAFLLCAIALVGCDTPGRDIEAGIEDRAKRGGPTTKAHIIDIMGKPDKVATNGREEKWEYAFAFDPNTRLSYPVKTIGKYGRVKGGSVVQFTGDQVSTIRTGRMD